MQAQLNGISMYFEEHGAGLPVVLVHGYPLDQRIWEPAVAEMKAAARIILPDLRGFGRSSSGGSVSSMRLMAEDLVALLDQLQAGKAVVVGHSMGGYVALEFASVYPDRLAGIGLVCSQAVADTPERRAARIAQAEDLLAHGTRGLAESMTPRLAADQQYHAEIYRTILRSRPEGLAAAARGMAERADHSGSLSSIAVPAVVITGLDDVLISPQRSRELASALKRAELVEIPAAGHMPMMEQPAQTAAALDKLLLEIQG